MVLPPMPPYSSGMNSSWMPSLSGSDICRTMSTGHSSRSSNAISSSSGRRFFAKSRSDFKLNCNVFLVIIVGASLLFSGRNLFRFADLAGQLRQELQDVSDDSNVGHLKDGSFGVFVNGDDEGTALKAGQMLERTADATCHVNLGLDRLAGRADLAGFRQPFGVDHGPGATHCRAQRVGQLLGDGDVVLFLDATADGNQNGVLRNFDVARLSDDGLEIAPSSRQNADARGLVDDDAIDGGAFLRLECAGTQVKDRAR